MQGLVVFSGRRRQVALAKQALRSGDSIVSVVRYSVIELAGSHYRLLQLLPRRRGVEPGQPRLRRSNPAEGGGLRQARLAPDEAANAAARLVALLLGVRHLPLHRSVHWNQAEVSKSF